MTYEEKRTLLYEKMTEYAKKDVCVAFSGGVDSSLLLKLAKECADKTGRKVYAVTFDTTLHPTGDLETAKKVAREIGAFHKVLLVNELEQEEIRFNPKDRCYLCKRKLFGQLLEYAKEVSAEVVLEGSNEDDLHVYRPGLRAVRELGILSPLAEAGFTKKEVRHLAGERGVSVAKRPSTPCLATRLPYGTEIKLEILEKIAAGEEFLKDAGFWVVRLRLHGEIARIEIPKEKFPEFLEKQDEIVSGLKKLGFFYITLDIQGFRSGSMDERAEKTPV